MFYELDQSQIDYLTGRANRRGLYDYYADIPKGTSVHAMFIDIDNFKRVNDIYGHNNGDILLKKISDLILRETENFTARIGGDEYVVIFNPDYYSHEALQKIAKKMIEAMPLIDFRKDILSVVSLSIGIVYDQSVDQDLGDILNKCDAAMYQAKYSGKNRYCIYDEDDSQQKLIYKIEAEMDDALENSEFATFFQPRMNMLTMQIVGAEAVSRWIHPVDGIRFPRLYLPVFEKDGFISKLDFYIIEEVCRIKASWKGKKCEHLPISVNISRLQLFDDTFTYKLISLCDKYEVPHNEIEILISESVFIKDNKEMTNMFNSLTDNGFKVSINDFGSGFSALSMFQNIRADSVKMHRDFINASTSSDRGRHVVRNIISLCKDLKLEVIADGVSDKECADFLMTCGCSIGSGKNYSEAMPEDDFLQYAEEYLSNPSDNFTFSLSGTLKSNDESKEAKMVGTGFEYQPGIFKNSESLFFPGGPVEKNCVIVPNDIMVSDSYTISMWIKPKENRMWSSALYVKFETGFCSIVPMSPDSHSDFRIRDSKEVSGWYDLVALTLQENVWYHYVVTYNAITERAISFVNGEVAFIMDNVPTNRFVKLIILGGDVFQPSFVGNICEVVFYNEAKDYDFVAKLHQDYVTNPDFNAYP